MTTEYDMQLNNERTERIKEIRESKKLSQKDVAEKIGRVARTYNNYETNSTPWDLEIIEKIAKEWSLSPVYLLYGVGERDLNISKADNQILEFFSQYSEEGKQKILEGIKLFVDGQNMTV